MEMLMYSFFPGEGGSANTQLGFGPAQSYNAARFTDDDYAFADIALDFIGPGGQQGLSRSILAPTEPWDPDAASRALLDDGRMPSASGSDMDVSPIASSVGALEDGPLEGTVEGGMDTQLQHQQQQQQPQRVRDDHADGEGPATSPTAYTVQHVQNAAALLPEPMALDAAAAPSPSSGPNMGPNMRNEQRSPTPPPPAIAAAFDLNAMDLESDADEPGQGGDGEEAVDTITLPMLNALGAGTTPGTAALAAALQQDDTAELGTHSADNLLRFMMQQEAGPDGEGAEAGTSVDGADNTEEPGATTADATTPAALKRHLREAKSHRHASAWWDAIKSSSITQIAFVQVILWLWAHVSNLFQRSLSAAARTHRIKILSLVILLVISLAEAMVAADGHGVQRYNLAYYLRMAGYGQCFGKLSVREEWAALGARTRYLVKTQIIRQFVNEELKGASGVWG